MTVMEFLAIMPEWWVSFVFGLGCGITAGCLIYVASFVMYHIVLPAITFVVNMLLNPRFWVVSLVCLCAIVIACMGGRMTIKKEWLDGTM